MYISYKFVMHSCLLQCGQTRTLTYHLGAGGTGVLGGFRTLVLWLTKVFIYLVKYIQLL